MKRLLFICLLLLMIPVNSNAWEFTMNGVFSHQFRSFARSGTNDLFGNTNTAQSLLSPGITTIGLSGPWNGQVVPEGLSSKGSIGSFNEQLLILQPTIIVNRAIRLGMEYSFQGNLNGLYQGGPNWANPPHYAGWVQMGSRFSDRFAGFTVGILNSAWANVETPLGLFKIGRYPFGFGPGWSGYNINDSYLSMITLDVPYAMMNFGIGMSLSDNGAYSDPYDTRNVNRTAHVISSLPDRNQTKTWDTLAYIKCTQPTFDLGVLYRFMSWNGVHAVPWASATLRDDVIGSPIAAPLANGTFFNTLGGAQGQTPTATVTSTPLSSDVYFNLLSFYFRFYQGRFFLNAEYDQEYIKSNRRGARPVSGYPKAWMLEGGVTAGPAKVSLANFYRSGHQRSGGELNFAWTVGTKTSGGPVIVTQISDKWSQFIVPEGGHTAIDPYQFIIGYYGTGNNSYDSSGYPTFQDYVGYGARVDYAMAANLNLFMSYLFSYRQSNTGSWWGQYSGGVYPPVLTGSNVPDNSLGGEWNIGIDWKLLENLNLGVKVGEWCPGDWFKYAYSDLSLVTPISDPTSGNSVFVNPGRSLDPIFGAKATISISY